MFFLKHIGAKYATFTILHVGLLQFIDNLITRVYTLTRALPILHNLYQLYYRQVFSTRNITIPLTYHSQ